MIREDRYSLLHRLLHWLIAIGIIGLIAVGLYMTGLEKDDPNRFEIYSLHKSIGVTVLGLVILRLISRAITYIPPLPAALNVLEKCLAKAVHFALYVGMLAMPISGIIMSNSAGYAVKWFSIELPRFVEKNDIYGKIAHEIHEVGGYVLIALISLHVLGALKHRFFDRKNDVLHRMF